MSEAVPVSDEEVARLESIETTLDNLIEQQAQNHRAANEREQMYRNSVRRYHQRRRSAHVREWAEHEQRMAQIHAQLSEEHREKAMALREGR